MKLNIKKMNVKEIVKYFEDHPSAVKQGKGFLAKRLHAVTDDVETARTIYKANRKKGHTPKILIFDLETAPNYCWTFNVFKTNIGFNQISNEWWIICWSAKWLGNNNVMSDCVTCEEALDQDDSRIVKSLWNLFDEADIIIAHNGIDADQKWANTRFIMNGLNPPSPYRIIDTCKIARKVFDFPSNKLDALAKYFGYPAKLDTNFDLWKGCMQGDPRSLEYMSDYNKYDTVLLENIFLKLLPWIPNMPNLSIIAGDNVCPFCGKKHYKELNTYYYTNANKYPLYRCNDCGGLFRGKNRIKINNNNLRSF